MPCEGYKSAEYGQNTAKNEYSQYAFERNKYLWAGERHPRVVIHEARSTMEEFNEVMSKTVWVSRLQGRQIELNG
jgi:hypothetical protein